MVWVHAQSCQASSRKGRSQSHLDLLSSLFHLQCCFWHIWTEGPGKVWGFFGDVKNANSTYNSNLHTCGERLFMVSCFSTRQTISWKGPSLQGLQKHPGRPWVGFTAFRVFKFGSISPLAQLFHFLLTELVTHGILHGCEVNRKWWNIIQKFMEQIIWEQVRPEVLKW